MRNNNSANDTIREIGLNVAELLRDEILKDKAKFADLPLEAKLDKFIKLMSSLKQSTPLVNMSLPILFDPNKVDRAERVLASENNVQKLLEDVKRRNTAPKPEELSENKPG